MKKKLLLPALYIMCVCVLAACGSKENSTTTEEPMVKEETEDNRQEGSEEQNEVETTEEPATEERDISIKDEMEEVEQKSLEYENGDWDLPQQEMNAKAYEWFTLWDEELNSLWERIDNRLSGEEKDALLEDQLAWIDRKEKIVIAAGYDAYGGSLQPQLESSKAMEMTRARAYVLAEILAKALGEDYTMPAEVQESLPEVDVKLDSVFESFQGSYTPSEDLTVVVSDKSPFSYELEEGKMWMFWYTNSDVLTESDVYAYIQNRIIFEKEGIYYILERSWEGDTIFVASGDDLLFMENVCAIELE